jgi:signal transduction histidine kinase/CheY-like chemotaxis protein
MRPHDVHEIRVEYIALKVFIIILFMTLLNPSLIMGHEGHLHVNVEALDQNFSQKILILNSYHQGDPWTDNITKSILDVFSKYNTDTEIHIQNLDTKRIFDRSKWNNFVKQTLDAYPKDYLDLIIVSDDNALSVLTKLRDEYKLPPVVYCGVAADTVRHIDTCSMFIGVEQHLAFKENIDLALKLFPKTEHIAFVIDRSKTGSTHLYEAKKALKEMDLKDQDIIWLTGFGGMSTNVLIEKLRTLPENTVVMFSLWELDGTGRFWDPSKYYSIYAKECNAPIFTVRDMGIERSFLGGLVTQPEVQGRLAANLGIRILSGELVEDIERIHDQNTYKFNWAELNKWHIRAKSLPPNSEIVNKPQTVYNQYRTFFFITLSLIILMFLLFWLLLLYHFRYRNYELQRTKMAKETERLANRYNILFEQSNSAIVIFELENSKVLSFNDKALDLFEVPEDKFRHYPLNRYFSNYDELRANITDLLKGPFELEVYKNDHRPFQAQIILSLLEEEDITYAYAIINDISLRKAQEEEIRISKARLNEALLNSKNSYWEWDLVNNVLYKDDSFWLALDIDPKSLKEDPIDSDYYLNAIHEEDQELFIDQLNEAIIGKRETIFSELRMSLLGKDTWVEVRGAIAKRDENGKGLAINGFMMNIDDRKHQEEELIKAKEKAEESDRLKSAFISNISHEIRTPLNGIVGFSNLLGRENLSVEEKRKYLSFINENNDLLLNLINDILEISRIETDSLVMHLESCNLHNLCENIIAQESIHLTPTVTLGLAESQNINVMLDKIRLTQILRNLLSNAIKFTEEGSVELGYKIKRDFIEFFVKDTGKGIPKDMQEKIFDRFVQVDPFSSGTGLGLSIAKVVIEKMGGKIWLESNPGEGSTFFFTIKYKKARIGIAEIEPSAPSKQTGSDAESGHTVLIAEHDESSFVLLNVILKGKFKIIRAVKTDDIKTLIERYHPDILIITTDMPGFSEELINVIRDKGHDLPIIGISDNNLDLVKQKELMQILDGHLSKPLNIKSLLDMLESKL